MPRYRVSRKAIQDLDAIWCFIARENETAAEDLINRIHSLFQTLARQPRIGCARPELSTLMYGLSGSGLAGKTQRNLRAKAHDAWLAAVTSVLRVKSILTFNSGDFDTPSSGVLSCISPPERRRRAGKPDPTWLVTGSGGLFFSLCN
jgi:plasmid stabilization system protein ParE